MFLSTSSRSMITPTRFLEVQPTHTLSYLSLIQQNSNYQLLVLLQPICMELDFFEENFSPNKKTHSYKGPLLVKLFDIKGTITWL